MATGQAIAGAGIRRVGEFFLAGNATVVGDVQVGPGSCLWYFVCARGDVAPIRVGRNCCVQDFTMLHCKHKVTLTLEDNIVVGHHAVVHCTRVGPWSLIGIGSRVLDDSVVGADCIVASGAVVPPGTIIPDGKVVAGVPAKIIRDVTDRDRAYIKDVVTRYVDLARAHSEGRYPPIAPLE